MLAYDLFSASFSADSADARFALLTMALETLIKPAPRALSVVDHVDSLIATTQKLSDRRSMNEAPPTFFTRCYEMRSKLARCLSTAIAERCGSSALLRPSCSYATS